MKKIEGICKLCLGKKVLVSQSHIIPNFIYKKMKDETDRFYQYRLDGIAISEKGIPFQTGYFEKHIFCSECETQMSKWEDYFKRFLYGGFNSSADIPSAKKLKNQEGIEFFDFIDVDYRKFKLLILSILWRSSISTLPFFRGISLGEKHEAILRKMIHHNDPGELDDYPFLIGTYLYKGSIGSDLIIGPTTGKKDGRTMAYFVFSGLFIFINISSHLIPQAFLEFTVTPKNTIRIIQYPEEYSDVLIKKLVFHKRD